MARLTIILTVGLAAAASAASAAYTGPCDGDMKAAKWCDMSSSFADRAAALVANLTKDEKAGLFVNSAAAVPRVNWPRYNWWSEALHGVARDGVATSFPQICGVASSLNKTLFHAIGDVTGTEARGKNNDRTRGDIYQGLTMWAPNINIFRDPRWGRGEETPGEDPQINGDYVTQFVTGMQGTDKTYIKAGACLKHYAAYSEEAGRQGFAAVVTAQDMEDTYLPAFSVGVEKANAVGIMCSYNAETYGEGVFGAGTQGGAIPSCANKGILNDLARGKWGFDGYITSDCGAVSGVANSHHYTNGGLDTVTAVLEAGMDTDCGGYMGSKNMRPLLDNSTIAPLADAALVHLFTTQFRLGFADPAKDVPYAGLGQEVVNTAAHQALAREAADQSLVLLQNEPPLSKKRTTLPLDAAATKKILVVGRNANATSNMQGNYFGTAPYLVSPCAGIAKHADVQCDDGADIAAAVKMVQGQDAIVLVVGLTSEGVSPNDEAEGHDRTALTLPGTQDDLIAKVAHAATAAGIPVAVVTMGGGPVDVTAAKENTDVGAIMWCGYPGQSGGDAIADALFGVTNPSGKLTMTWYPQHFADTTAVTNMNMRPNKTSGFPGRSYRFYTGKPVFAFGHGLSYTTFKVSTHIDMKAQSLGVVRSEAADKVTLAHSAVVGTATVTVTNTGARAGAHSVLLFTAPPTMTDAERERTGAPLQNVVGFDRVLLEAGKTATVTIDIHAYHLTYSGRGGDRLAREGEWKFWTGSVNDRTNAAGIRAATLE